MKKYGLVLFFLLLTRLPAGAAEVHLQDGKTISGTIIELSDDLLVLQSRRGRLDIPAETIASIEFNDRYASLRRRNLALSLKHPISTIFGGYEESRLTLEAQTAFTRRFALNALGELYLWGPFLGNFWNETGWSIALGPQVRVWGEYLNGFFLGCQPGYANFSDGSTVIFVLENGYQRVYPSGFSFAMTSGIRFYDFYGLWGHFYWNIQLGYAFKHPFIRAC